MIVDHTLDEAEQKKAQRIFQVCSGLTQSGCSFCSETILVLLALSINIKEVWVSGIGSLTYCSYLVLPCGFYLAAKMGTCSSIRLTKIVEGLMCLLIMFSAIFLHGLWQILLFFTGVILMYAARSSGCAMYFPLQKNISTEKTLAAMIIRNQITATLAGMAVSLLIAWLLKIKPDLLPYFLIGGFFIFVCEGLYVASMPEPAVLTRMASQPILKQLVLSFRNVLMRKQLVTGCILNLVLAMILPINILAAKIGFGLNDSLILILSIVQIVMQITASYTYKKMEKKIGPRNIMVMTYPLTWVLALYWVLIPEKISFWPAVFPFALGGMLTVFYSTALANYFMISIPNRIQVGGTFLVFVITGGLMGAIGTFLNPLILSGIKIFFDSNGIQTYRLYFLITGFLFVPGIISPFKLPVKYKAYNLRVKQKKEGPSGIFVGNRYSACLSRIFL